MQKKLHFLVVDDDKVMLKIYSSLLIEKGYEVTTLSSSEEVLSKIMTTPFDCILCDLLLPKVDGFELFQQIRKIENIVQPKFIIITSKAFDYDKRHATHLGIDGYLTKPVNPETFVDDILSILDGRMALHFWGCRGTLPVPGEKTIRYGGNTNCVTFQFGNKYFFIFDAGTGIKELSNFLLKENKFPINAKIFISHPHYDHINGIPFFVPLYMSGNEFEILGAGDSDIPVEKLISGQMDTVYFPITIREFAAKLKFRNLSEEEFDIDELHVKTILLNHPGQCLGYRVEYKRKSFCYITDNELYLPNSSHFNQFEVDRLINFIKNTDVLIIDATYNDEEYVKKEGWGHSSVSRVIDVADKANVKLLCLFHHDPDQTDDGIDLKLKHARDLLNERHSKTTCIAPREGDEITI